MLLSHRMTIGFRLTLALAVLIMTWQSLASAPLGADSVNDKLAHFLAFVVLAFLADLGWEKARFNWIPAVLLTGYGALIEVMQSFVAGRTASLADLGADLLGLLAYWLLFCPLVWRFLRRDATDTRS